MKIRLIDREVVDGRPRLTIQTRRWWQWTWRTEVWLQSESIMSTCDCHEPHPWWHTAEGEDFDCDGDARLNRINAFAENEELRTTQLTSGDNVVEA